MVIFILNFCFNASSAFHNVLHGFRAGPYIGTAFIESKLLQKLTAMREEILYAIFMCLHNSYDALDRYRCLEILEGYGVEPRARCILCAYCDRIWMVDCMGGYYRAAFQGFWGVNQGEPLTFTNFYVVVDAVVHHWILLVEGSVLE